MAKRLVGWFIEIIITQETVRGGNELVKYHIYGPCVGGWRNAWGGEWGR